MASKKEKSIRVVMLYPLEQSKQGEIENTLDDMQEFVGGNIECVGLDGPGPNQCFLVCNEDGKFIGLPINRSLFGGTDILLGNAFIAASDVRGNMVSLTEEQMEHYLAEFEYPLFDDEQG